jgi:DNA-binding response OmpR family regulator
VAMGGSIFVLFVDDDAAFADAVACSLESAGMRTIVALGSVAALDAFDSNAIDVVSIGALIIGFLLVIATLWP